MRKTQFYDPERQLAYCFGCHKGGDMFAFIEEIEGVDFGRLALLADKASVDLAQYKPAGMAPRVGKDRKRSCFANEEGKFYRICCGRARVGKVLRI